MKGLGIVVSDLVTVAGLFYVALLVGGYLTSAWLPAVNRLAAPLVIRTGGSLLVSGLLALVPVLAVAFLAGVACMYFVRSRLVTPFVILLAVCFALSTPAPGLLPPHAGTGTLSQDSLARVNRSIRVARVLLPVTHFLAPCAGALLVLVWRRHRPATTGA